MELGFRQQSHKGAYRFHGVMADASLAVQQAGRVNHKRTWSKIVRAAMSKFRHGGAESPGMDPNAAIALTLEYLAYVREVMGRAVEEMIPFAEAFDAADWSEFEKLPAYEATHRRNAYGVYLSLEAAQFE